MKNSMMLVWTLVAAFLVTLGLQSFRLAPKTENAASDSLCFARDILPIFNSNCAQAGCHDAHSHTMGYDLSTYKGILRGIQPGNSASSRLLIWIDAKAMPVAPYEQLPDSLRNRIAKWIDSGATVTDCSDQECDSLNVDYSNDIKPILQINCVGCHQSSLAGGGVILDNDTNNNLIKESIFKAVAHVGVGVPMPMNLPGLTTCQLAKIGSWSRSSATSNVSLGVSPIGYPTVKRLSNDFLSISFQADHSERVAVSIFNSLGTQVQLLSTRDVVAGVNDIILSTSLLQKGAYFVRLMTQRTCVCVSFVQ